MGFLYFVNRAAVAPEPDSLPRLGLAHAFERPPESRQVSTGPGGASGVLLAQPPTDLARFVFKADAQTWRRIPGHADTWVGRWNDEAIGPTELARRDMLSGHSVKLGDGQQWLVPVARAYIEDSGELRWYNALPAVWDVDDEGNWVRGAVEKRYAALWNDAEQAADAFSEGVRQMADGKMPFDMGDHRGAAVRALGANYRLGPAEVGMLGLFSDQTAIMVLDALCDGPTRREWAQKKMAELEAAGSSLSGGEAA